ncbi:MAG: PAS domain-containing protein [Pseudomonadota bacterium]
MLRLAEQHFEAELFAALAHRGTAVTLGDPTLDDCPLVMANEAFCALAGRRREEVLGRNCRFLQGADTSREAVAELRASIDARRPASAALKNYRSDGAPFWNLLYLAPVRLPTGRVLMMGAQAVAQPETARLLERAGGSGADAWPAPLREALRMRARSMQMQLDAVLSRVEAHLQQQTASRMTRDARAALRDVAAHGGAAAYVSRRRRPFQGS